jgi:formylglycine-generating enzyme required for sulfatase activity
MLYCLNPDCAKPKNPENNKYCYGCGKELTQTTKNYLFRVRYRVLKLLGEGGFGRTYQVEDLDYYHRLCAMKKFIAPLQGEELVKAKELFQGEAEKLKQLNHPQIPKLYAYFQHNNCLYLVEEYIEGDNLLKELFCEGSFNERKIINLLNDILPILDYIHSQNVLHRDIKPANIMRRHRDDTLILIDFGGAKVISDNTASSHTAIYTPGYAAIEHIAGQPQPASDLYSLGATCVRLLTGCLPLANQADELYDAYRGSWLWREYLQKQGKKIEYERLAKVLEGMLENLSRDRYQSAREVLQDLNQTLIFPPTKPPIPPTPSYPTMSRWQFLKITSYVLGGTILGVGLHWLYLKLLRERQSITISSLQSFAFSTVTVNDKGEIIDRAQKEAQFFAIDFGNNTILELVFVPGGKFFMGSPETEKERDIDEGPQREVTINPFFIGKYPILQTQWEIVMGKNPSHYRGEGLPAENINWYDCIEYCQKLSQLTGKKFRLPSEAEWEYACRAGTTTPFYFGETITSELANYDTNKIYAQETKGMFVGQTKKVGSFPPNAFGLYDLHGNVWEWCADPWHSNYQNAPLDGSVWTQDGNNQRAPFRGGSWVDPPSRCRSACRGDNLQGKEDKKFIFGCRVVYQIV